MGSISRYKIAYKALGIGVHNYTFDVDSELFTSVEGSEILAGDCSVEVELQRSESMLELNVSIDGEVEVACDRCLDPCTVEICFDGRLIVKFSAEVDDYDGEVMWLSPTESELDLRQYIYESIVLSLPYQRIHPEGGCNAEMMAKLISISCEQMAQEKNEDLPCTDEQEEDNVALPTSELEKLKALKAMMTKKE